MIFRAVPVLLAALVLLSACDSGGPVRWDMPTPYPDGEHHTRNIRQFAADVKDATGGELEIVVHSNASLFKHPEIHRAVRSGQVPIGEILMGLLGNDDPIFKVDNIPFLASDFDEARKLWQLTRPHVEESLEKQGLMLLYAVPWPPQGLFTNRPVDSVDDFRGRKMRAYSPLTSRLAVLLGAAPTTVQTPEIPQAFSTGIIDVMVTSAATGTSSSAWDFVDHYTDTRAWIPKNMVIVNARAFKRMTEAQQQALLDAAAKAEARGWEMARRETTEKTRVLVEHGMTVAEPTARLRRELRAIGQIMAREWARETGARGAEILRRLATENTEGRRAADDEPQAVDRNNGAINAAEGGGL